jgi:hypothetical protein
MIRMIRRNIALAIAANLGCLLLLSGTVAAADAQDVRKAEFRDMARVEQYQMPGRDDEIAMARSAAPASISADAEILVLGSHGYETAVKGKNGFTCLVMRSWAASFGDAEFWNAKIRSPICYNPAAVSTVLPVDLEKTQWVMARLSEAEMRARSKSSGVAHKVPAPGSMAYMMSKQQHLSDADGHWHPHVMMYQPHTDLAAWGANLPGSPVTGFEGGSEEATVFVVPVIKWSDGTSAAEMH